MTLEINVIKHKIKPVEKIISFSRTITECANATTQNQGINEVFSIGSQNQKIHPN